MMNTCHDLRENVKRKLGLLAACLYKQLSNEPMHMWSIDVFRYVFMWKV